MLADKSLPALLEELAAPSEVPGSGSALAVALALAAATLQMASRLSTETWPEANGIAAQAESLRERATAVIDEDAETYRRALEAGEGESGDTQEQRDWALGQAMIAAAEPPLELARLAGDLAELCRYAAARVEPRVRADVVAAAALAAGVARGARELVAVNLTALEEDPRVVEADRIASAAADAVASTGP